MSSLVAEAPPKRQRVGDGEVELARGAEGVVTRVSHLGRAAVRKERFSKPYRHPELDAKLTSRRLAAEARALLRLRKAGIRVPAVYLVDVESAVLILEDLGGVSLKDFLRVEGGAEALRVMGCAGSEVAKMHQAGVVHGDLTTGNLMVLDRAGGDAQVCLIDFGLSSAGDSCSEEDMAVDLYVLERAVISAHSEAAQPFNEAFLEAYAKQLRRPGVLTRLAEVRMRGRKRDMLG